jgi:hypothetical protein
MRKILKQEKAMIKPFTIDTGTYKGQFKLKTTWDKREYSAFPESKNKVQRYFRRGRGKTICYLHREIFEHYNGKIKKSFQIHHLDGNIYNNDISNLALLSNSEHQKEHSKKRRKHFICSVCGEHFEGVQYKMPYVCSKECYNIKFNSLRKERRLSGRFLA